jgi:hypothetical protein
VDFEPFKDGEFVESELGMIPEGCTTISLSKMANYLNGLAMQKFRPLEGENGLPVLKIKELGQDACNESSELCSPSLIDEKYIVNDELSILKDIQTRLFSTHPSETEKCLKIACEIRGLGTAGASGLLALLFPKDFGTADQFVVKRLQEINHPVYNTNLQSMTPEILKIKDAIILNQIMKEKASELNRKFKTDFWTPRKLDMILWAFGR